MKRLSPRRAVSVAAAAVIGLFGVLVVATPASAHYTVITGSASCETSTGNWKVVWSIASKLHYSSTKVKFFSVNATHGPGGVTDADPFTETPLNNNTYPYNLPGPFTGTQVITDGSATSAKIEVLTKWNDGYKDSKASKGEVKLEGGCVKDHPSPTVSYQSNCDGTVLVTLRNNGGTAPATFTITGVPGTTSVAPNATPAPIPVPAGTGHITVTEGDKALGSGYDWTKPESCTPVKITSKKDCTSLTVQLDNPDGPTANYKVVVGQTTLTGTLAPGAVKTFDPFPASTGTTAVVTINNLAPETIAWETQEVCTPPTTPPDLPNTGSGNLTSLLSIGGALLVGGAGLIGLLFLLRRRRTTAAG